MFTKPTQVAFKESCKGKEAKWIGGIAYHNFIICAECGETLDLNKYSNNELQIKALPWIDLSEEVLGELSVEEIESCKTVDFEHQTEAQISEFLSNSEKEYIFREVERKYRLEDAKYHFLNFLCLNEDDLESRPEEAQVIIDDFNKSHDVSFEKVLSGKSTVLNDIVDFFESKFDCDLDENSMFANAVEIIVENHNISKEA